jgi:hypothetical protein
MDLLGKVIRDYLREAERANLRTAVAVAEEFLDEKMNESQVREMLFASGFETKVVEAAIRKVFPRRKN